MRYRGNLISTLADEWDLMGMRPEQSDGLFPCNAVKACGMAMVDVETARRPLGSIVVCVLRGRLTGRDGGRRSDQRLEQGATSVETRPR